MTMEESEKEDMFVDMEAPPLPNAARRRSSAVQQMTAADVATLEKAMEKKLDARRMMTYVPAVVR